jgi:drug/metabolite transporter (DMT)-like permease
MFLSANIVGAVFGLTSALVWGGADFSGGVAARKHHPFQVLVLSAFSGILILGLCALLWQESLPNLRSFFWAILAGISGAVGISSLYKALAIGNAAVVSSTCAVISATMPVIAGILLEGVPSTTRMLGFGLALIGIWMVSESNGEESVALDKGFKLSVLAGLCFGGFYILIGQVEPGLVFTPLIAARIVTFLAAVGLVKASQLTLPDLKTNPVALLAGVMDASGNVFYLLAKQFTRLDVAAVLSSLYPVITVLLASLILKQLVSGKQWMGLAICLLATLLITL